MQLLHSRRSLLQNSRPALLVIFGGLVLALLGLVSPTIASAKQPLPSIPATRTVRSINVQFAFPNNQFKSALNLQLDRPIAATEAQQYAQKLSKSVVPVRQAVTASGPTPVYIECDGSGSWTDSNGTFSLQYTCTSGVGYLAWGYRISPAVQAIFHGQMNGANPNYKIDYQDYFTFRHNVNGGGTGSITISGTVRTLP